MLNSIEAERARHHLSKEELAKKLNISVKTYYNWINEETDVPSTKLVMMAKMFGTDIDYLLKDMTGVQANVECLSEQVREVRRYETGNIKSSSRMAL